MGQILHGIARTTAAVRRAMQDSQESLRALAKRHGVNQKTVAGGGGTDRLRISRQDQRSRARWCCRLRKKRLSSPSVATRYCRWTIASTPCRQRSRISRGLRCTDVFSATTSPGCLKSKETSPNGASSAPIPSATSTSTLPRSGPSRASYICSWRSTEPASSSSSSCTRRPRLLPPVTSCIA